MNEENEEKTTSEKPLPAASCSGFFDLSEDSPVIFGNPGGIKDLYRSLPVDSPARFGNPGGTQDLFNALSEMRLNDLGGDCCIEVSVDNNAATLCADDDTLESRCGSVDGGGNVSAAIFDGNRFKKQFIDWLLTFRAFSFIHDIFRQND